MGTERVFMVRKLGFDLKATFLSILCFFGVKYDQKTAGHLLWSYYEMLFSCKVYTGPINKAAFAEIVSCLNIY